MLPRERFHRLRSTTVRIAFAQYGVHRRAQDHGKAGLQRTLLFGRRLLEIVGYVVALSAEFRNRFPELRNRGADVGELNDVGLRCLRQLPQAGQLVGNLLVVPKTLREVGDNTSSERDVSRFDLHPGPLEVRSQDGQQRVRRECGCLVGLGPRELHVLVSV